MRDPGPKFESEETYRIQVASEDVELFYENQYLPSPRRRKHIPYMAAGLM